MKIKAPITASLLLVLSLQPAFSAPRKASGKVSQATVATLIDTGSEQYKVENYHAAVDYYRKAFEKDSTNPRVHFGLGASYLALGNYNLAVEHLLRALELNPALVEAYFSLAYAYQGQGKQAEALSVYRQGLGLDLNKALPRSSFYNRVTLSADEDSTNEGDNTADDYSKSIGESSLSLAKSDSSAPINLLSILNDPNYYSAQIQDYNEELEAHPDDVQLLLKLGNLYVKNNQFEEAQRVQKKLESLNSELATELQNKIDEALKKKDKPKT